MLKVIEAWTEEDQPNIFLANNIEGVRETRNDFIRMKKGEIKNDKQEQNFDGHEY